MLGPPEDDGLVSRSKVGMYWGAFLEIKQPVFAYVIKYLRFHLPFALISRKDGRRRNLADRCRSKSTKQAMFSLLFLIT